MSNYIVMFNFETGKYDVIEKETGIIKSSWGTHADAISERSHLLGQIEILD